MNEVSLNVAPNTCLRLYEFERFRDDSGYKMKVDFMSEPFSCVGKDLYFEDFTQVVVGLEKAHSELLGSVAFKMPHEDDSITIEYLNLGGVVVSGSFYSFVNELQKVQLCFSTDQSYMGQFIHQLRLVVNELHS